MRIKKYIFLLILAAISLGVHAEYNRLLFRTLTGEEKSIGLSDMNIIYTNGEMIATSGNESVKIPLATLKSMEFSNSNSVGSAMGDDVSEVNVYSVNGICLGNFDSKADALNALPTGVYILKSKKGVTSKVSISK